MFVVQHAGRLERISVHIRTEVSDKCDCTEHAERISVRIRTEVLLSSYGYDMQTSSVCIGTDVLKAVRDEAGTGQHHNRCDQWYTATVSQSEYLSMGYLFRLLGAFCRTATGIAVKMCTTGLQSQVLLS